MSQPSWGGIFKSLEGSWEDVLTEDERIGGPSPNGSSWWKCFLTCEFKFYWEHVKRMKMTPEHPRWVKLRKNLEEGGLYHEALARYYLEHLKHYDAKGEKISDITQEDLDIACTDALWDIVKRAGKVVPGTAAAVTRYLTGWLTVAGPGASIRDDRRNTMYIEHAVQVDKDGFLYSTRFDRIAWEELLNGAVIKEYKTASQYSELLLASYMMDPQFLGQMYCWEHSDLKKKHGPLKEFHVELCIKTKAGQYPTEKLPVNMKAVRAWAKDMKSHWMRMQECQFYKVWPKRRGNCMQYMQPCPLYEYCTSLGEDTRGWTKKSKGEY